MNRRLKPIFLMAPPEDSGESGEQPQGGGAGETPAKAEGDKPADDGKTFTQADVDRIIAGRLSKYSDYDQIKAQVNELTPLREQFDAIAKAFGAKDDAPPDPAVLADQVTQEQAKAREAAVQLAVYRSPAAKTADVDGLLDSTSFQRTLADVDPNDGAAVDAAVKTFVDANPRFKAQTEDPFPTPGQAGIGVAGGGAAPASPKAADLAQIEADLRAAKRP